MTPSPRFKAIAAAQAPFVSRGDKSGTNALELRLWSAAGSDPKSAGGEHGTATSAAAWAQALNAAAGDERLHAVRPRHLAQLQQQGADSRS